VRLWNPESLAVLIRKVWRVVERDAAGRTPQGRTAEDEVGGGLDRRVGEAIDIYVNNRLVARGEVVIVDERLGVTMTEIIKDGDIQT